MKRVVLLALCVILIFSNAFADSILPDATKSFYAADYANILSDETEGFIISNSSALCDQTSAQIVVATVETLNGANEREYALELGRKWKVGGEDDNGILILVALEERKIDIEIGYGLEGAIPDSKSGRFLDTYALPYLKNYDFDNGILNLYKALLSEVYAEYGLEVPENAEPVEEVEDYDEDVNIGQIIITLVLVAFIIYINIKRGGGRGNGGGRFYGGVGTFGGSGGSSRSGFGGAGSRGGGGSFGGGGSSRGF